jgi:hypothetical protein
MSKGPKGHGFEKQITKLFRTEVNKVIIAWIRVIANVRKEQALEEEDSYVINFTNDYYLSIVRISNYLYGQTRQWETCKR